jgi:predicted TIM-barrel fold metal-dependent hydrolase
MAKIIDFGNRPPIDGYRPLFKSKERLIVDKETDGWTPFFSSSESMRHVGEERGLQLWLEELDQAGISEVVVEPRHNAAMDILDSTIAELEKRFPERIIGLAQINLEKPMDDILQGIDNAIHKLGLHGVHLEPGNNPGGAMHVDDERLFPIYDKCIQLDVPVLFMTGGMCGPDISYTDPWRYDKVAGLFPTLIMVMINGLYPYVNPALYVANKRQNIYLSPNAYIFSHGGELYIQAMKLQLQDSMLFSSGYPWTSCTESVAWTKQFPISPEVMEKYLYGNAAKLLKLP